MLKKTILYLLFFITLVNLYSCKDEEPVITLILTETTIEFNATTALEKLVPFTTNASSIGVSIPQKDQEWCSATVVEQSIKIEVSPNNSTETSRTTTITVTANGTEPQFIKISQTARNKNSEKRITSYTISSDFNDIKTNVIGMINEEKKTITISTSAWIGNIENLIATFDATGRVFIDDTEQISGKTPNSFWKELVYKVVAEDGTSAEYTVVVKGPMFTGLPIISVNIVNNQEVVEKTVKLPAVFNLLDSKNEEFEMKNVTMTIRGRGNSTWGMPKKPYRIDFPEKTSVFGLTKAKKWILLANYQDPTLLMNDVAFELGRRFGLQFNHSSIHVELFVNGTYRGNYQLTEQKETGKGRVDIDTENGGFLVELDSYYDEDRKFKTNYLKLPVMVSSPELNSDLEMEYIRLAMQGLENALFEPGFPNNSYESHTDVNSLINYMLINEITGNNELHHPKSTYCYRDANNKIMWGPLWDFDWAFGYNNSTKRFFYHNDLLFYPNHPDNRPGAAFFSRFTEIPDFKTKYKTRWQEMRPQVLDIVNYIDQMAVKLDKSQKENFSLSIATPPTYNTSYTELISQMKKWIVDRVTFMDSEIDKKFK